MVLTEIISNKRILVFLLVFVLGLNFWLGLVKNFDSDELEHFQSSWYVSQGLTPYLDFFEHHQPLLWYLFSPLFYLFGGKISILFLGRFIAWLVLLGIVFLTYQLGKKIFNSGLGLLAAVILATTLIFLEKAIEFRPDSFQTFFILLSVYFLIDFFQKKRNIFLIGSGLAMAAAFLFSAKAVFVLPVFLFFFLKNGVKAGLKNLIIFGAVFGGAIIIFLSLIGSFNFDFFRDFYFYNFTLNVLGRAENVNLFTYWARSLLQNGFFWILALLGLIFSFKEFKKTSYLSLPSIFLFLSLLIMPAPFRQYYMPLIPFLALLVSWFLLEFLKSKQFLKIFIVIFIVSQLLIPIGFLLKRAYFWTIGDVQKNQIARTSYVLDNSSANDLVHDGLLKFNLFRRDLAYVWFSWDGFQPVLKDLKIAKAEPDIYALILEKKPKIISRTGLTSSQFSELAEFYQPSIYNDIYLRKVNVQ